MSKDYQLIVFDWDGTLVDSTGHITNCMKKAINELRLPALTDETISHIIGLGLPEAVRTLYPAADIDTLQMLTDAYRHAWLNNQQQPPALFSHAQQLIEDLAQQEIFLAVATGKSRRGLNRAFSETGLGNYFHTSRCADECHSKPHPQMLMEIMDYLGVRPENTLMIGDTEFDLQMASNAGAHSLGVSHGAHSLDKLLGCTPQAVVHDLYQTQQWLNNPDAIF